MRWNPFNKPSFPSFILILISLFVQIIVARADLNFTESNNPTNASISSAPISTPTTTLSKPPITTQIYKYGLEGSSLQEHPATLSDGTLVFLVKVPKLCSITLQILYADGSTGIFDKLPQDPDLFCDISYAFTLRVYPIGHNLVLVTYILQVQSSYQHQGIIIDVMERIPLYNTILYEYPMIPEYSTVSNASSLTFFSPNIDSEDGFLMAYFHSTNAQLVWWKWKNNKLMKVYDKSVELPEINDSLKTPGKGTSVFPTKTGGFGIGYTTWNNNTKNDPLFVTGQVFLKFLGVDHELKGPFLIYQTSLNTTLGLNSCSVSYDKNAGYQCMLELDLSDKNSSLIRTLKIDFWTTGSVIKVTNLGEDKIKDGVILGGQPLMTGGFLITTINDGVNGYIVNNTGVIVDDWGLPNDILFISGVFPNNTAWALSSNTSDSSNFGIFSSKLKVLNEPSDYDNIFITGTSPEINATLIINDDYELQSEITMEFSKPIKFSEESLSIYQNINNTYLLRQKILATDPYLTLDKKSKILNLTNAIYNSTFNVPGGNYSIEMDYNFVKTLSEDEPLLDIRKNRWRFTLANVDNPKSSDPRIGILKLKVDFSLSQTKGLLKKDKRKEFLQNLLNDISSFIPCDANRIKLINSNFIDLRNKGGKQFAFKIKIDKPVFYNEKTSSQKIFSDLKEMIDNFNNTGLANREYAKYLDQNAGLVEQGSIMERYKEVIIIGIIVFIILVILYIISVRKFNQGRNITIFKHALIATDFILDILFVVNNASEVQIIFIPSIIFTVIPATANVIISVFINIYEISHNKSFQDWINRYATIIFREHSIAYDVIPTLTLVTSLVVLLADSLWRFYYALMHLIGYYRHEEHFWGPGTDSDTSEEN
ncbi:14717_t:CDS:2 [Funneliformis geosporum]|uniref:14717_t:CDS:1 n=1 Tax=Funneliformis geosporum TaxID=1117311 RepID=A0A9W4SG48_9GLOM|nr:14717_t:CDS:2 [Funneliformis geosporum]